MGYLLHHWGISVEIYKNWLYVKDEKAWEEGGGYIKPTIMEIWNGEIVYKDLEIYAKRGLQYGIYCVVKERLYGEKKNIMFGIGCSGYADSDWIGVSNESVDFFINMLHKVDDESCGIYGISDAVKQIDFSKALRFNQGDAFFAEKIGFSLPSTKVGDAEGTILSQTLTAKRSKISV